MTDGADVQAAFAATLVDEWVRAGVTDAVVAPGSRSTPLIVALADDGRIQIHVVLDERSAGFWALGLGLARGRPAVVVTTSGTAAAELHPAVIEAHQAGVPLLAVTADRPAELHRVGAPQTIEQDGLFAGALRWSASPGVADRAAAWTWRSLAARAVSETTGHPEGPGPVHLNLAFREPLLGRPTAVPQGRPGGAPWHRVAAGTVAPPGDVVADLAAMAGAGRRGLIVAGAGLGPGGPGAVAALSSALGWPVLADPPSGARVPGPWTVAAADTLLRVPSIAAWRPDVVLRLGQPWASRVLSTWLSGLGPAVEQILVDPFGRWADPERHAQRVARGDVSGLAEAVGAVGAFGAMGAVGEVGAVGAVGASGVVGPTATGASGAVGPTATAAADVSAPTPMTEWAGGWARAESAAQGAIDDVLAAHRELTEPGLARALAAALPGESRLFVSSSMPVRDLEWYARPREGLQVLANRGANGIDGIISTALGIAVAGPVTALLGDLAFLYDAGALLWARSRDVDCTLVVVDNDGGGIFSFLPQADGVPRDQFERFWGTAHGLDLVQVAAAYRIPVIELGAPAELPAALVGGGVRVVHARTERAANVAVHREIEAAVRDAVTRLQL